MQLRLFDDSISPLVAHSALRQGLDTVRAANNGGTPVRDGKLDPAAQGNAYSVQAMPPEEESPFGPVIYAYSRAQAIEDGVLVDVTVTAKEVSFRWPVVITAALHDRLTPSQHDERLGQDYDARLWDVLWVAAYTAKLSDPGTDTVTFAVVLQEVEAKTGQPVNVDIRLRSVCGPGDEGEPVVTIGFPEDF